MHTAPSTSLRIDIGRFIDAGSMAGRIACLNAAAGRRLSSTEVAGAWLEVLKAVAAEGNTALLGALIPGFLRLAPYHAKADGLYRLWRGEAAPAGDALVFLILSCTRNLPKARALHARLAAAGATAVVARGEPGIGEPRWGDDGVVAVDAPDTYEALPQKLLAAIDAVVRRHGRAAILKLDDDCQLAATFNPARIARIASCTDFAGHPVGGHDHDRCWHLGKTADTTMGPYARRFHGAWARGGAYLLGANAVEQIHREWAFFPDEFAGECYEDKMVGDFLRRAGIALTPQSTEDWGIHVDLRDRLVADAPAAPSAPAAHAKAAPQAWACTEDFLRSLPGPIAVVGNGRPVRDFGAVIDRYPTVIRLNNYRLAGFEAQVGTCTTARCTSGWTDIEPRGDVPEFSPFTEGAAESANVAAYRAKSGSALPTAEADVHVAWPQLPRPSTGLALLTLLSALGRQVDVFGFDGFASGHYWTPDQPMRTTHSSEELPALLSLPGVTLYGESYPYAQLYDFCHTEHDGYNHNEGLAIYRRMGGALKGESILEFGAGNGQLSAWLERQGNRVTAVEVSGVAFARIPVAHKIQGDCLTLPLLDQRFDRFVSMDVLEHLTENDIRIVIREAARLAGSILVTVSTRPSGLLGPRGENLHLTVRPVQWWLDQFAPYFDITTTRGDEVGQLVLEGRRHEGAAPKPVKTARRADGYELPAGYRARPQPEYYVDSAEGDGGVTWQPDVYPLAADLARSLGCNTIVDIGCGHARKLSQLHPEFELIGVDYGPNIAHCRQQYRFGTWLEADLENDTLLPIPDRVLSRSVVVCSDVIEHLVDPRPLLDTLRTLLQQAPAVVISTPDRVRTHGPAQMGPPPNPAHTREWELGEFQRLLQREGFHIAAATHTRSNDRDHQPATIVAVVVNPQHPALASSRFAAAPAAPAPAPAATSQARARARVMALVD